METQTAEDKLFTAPLVTILITVFIDLIGFGMVIPILPFYAMTYQASPRDISFLFSIYSWMQFFFAPILGRLSDIYGRRPILFVSIIGSAIGYFLMGWAGALYLVFAGRIIGGVTGGNISTAQAYIADVTSKANRAKGMGLFGATFGFGFILGPAIAGILSKYGVHVPFYFAAGLSLANAIAVFFVLPESLKKDQMKAPPERPNRILELISSLKDKEFGTLNLVYFLLITSFSIMTYAFVLFTAYRYGYNAEQNGFLFAFVGVIAIIGQGLLFGRLVRIFGETKLTVAGCFLMAVSLFSLPFLGPRSGGLTGLLIACTVMSIGNAFASPSITSLASKISSEEKQGSSLGILQSGASLARAVGPLLGGVLLNSAINTVDDTTVTRTFGVASGLMLVATVFAIYAAKVIKRHIDDHQLTSR